VGAAGMLGGVTRMTISLTVILLEVSSDIQLLMPIMIAILCAKVRTASK
jgi:chloride channel 7